MSLTYDDATHKYRLDGKPVPSVTGLLNDGKPKPAIAPWAARTVAEYVADNPNAVEAMWAGPRHEMVTTLKNVPWAQRDEAANRGTQIHAIAEKLTHGEDVKVPAALVSRVEGYVRWLDEWQPRVILSERMVASRRHGYAGRFDLLAWIGEETWMLDLKTSKGVYAETALQLSAYAEADFYINENDREETIPLVDRLGAIHIREDGCDLIPMADNTIDEFDDFLAVAAVAKAHKRIQTYKGKPLTREHA